MLPSGSPLITAVEITNADGMTPKLRILSIYNPLRHNTGLPLLATWPQQFSDWKIPTVLGMDGNLHHPDWNPVNYHHTHPRARELFKICGCAGYKIQSQRHVPTFYPRARGKPTTIDLTWINHELSKRNVVCETTSNNFGSDHQLLTTTIQLSEKKTCREHNSATLGKLDKASYCNSVANKLSKVSKTLTTIPKIDTAVNMVTGALPDSFLKQGKTVKTNEHRHKAWWDEKKLRPMIKEWNRARRWMILSGTYEEAQCYWEWNNHVKYLISELKRQHWREFLAKTQGGITFKAFKYTRTGIEHSGTFILERQNISYG